MRNKELACVGAVPGVSQTKRLDRSKWHRPLISIVVPHYNYSDLIEDALLSILDQTYENWECVVVDDASSEGHRNALEEIVRAIVSDKIRVVHLDHNLGQTLTFFAGLNQTSGEFVSILDPDDRYAPTFLEESLNAHLNPAAYCPVLSTDQYFLRNGAVITGINGHFNLIFVRDGAVPAEVPTRLTYIPPQIRGWHWTTSSSLMFRRSALDLLRPRRPLSCRNSTDAYLAQGAHLLGGSLYLNRPLVYRMAHDRNDALTGELFAVTQAKHRPGGAALLRLDAIEAIKANGAYHHLFKDEIRKNPLKRWRRSLMKRWRWLVGGQ
jgi:glycosyltransferase involved in cell wall biosynthesis